MIRLILLCTTLQLATTKNIGRNYDREYEKGILKKSHWTHQSSKHNILQNHSYENVYDYINNWPSVERGDDLPVLTDLGDSRRTNVLRWIKQLFVKSTEKPTDKEFEDLARTNRDEEITGVLHKLTDALDGLNRNLQINNENKYLTLRVPVEERRINDDIKRIKRETQTELEPDTSVLSAVNISNITREENSTRVREGDVDLETKEEERKETTTVSNDAKEEELLEETPIFVNDSESNIDADISGRRMMLSQDSMKYKLLDYLEDMFNDIETKIQPLTRVKLAISSDNNYRIGYVIANIDTLEVNLRKLKNEMRMKRLYWSEREVMELFDKLKATNSVVSTLLDTLRSYLTAPSYY